MAKSSKPANPRSNHHHKKSRDPRSHHKTTELQAAREIRRLTKTSQRCRRQLAEAVKPLVSMLRSSESPLVALSFFFFKKRNPSHIRFFLPLSLSRFVHQTKPKPPWSWLTHARSRLHQLRWWLLFLFLFLPK